MSTSPISRPSSPIDVETKVLKGLTVPETDYVQYGDYYFWSQNAAARYHTPILNAFLDTYLK